MKIARRFEEEVATVPLAPLIDIVFLTLVFFMTASVYATMEAEIDITLPTASSAVMNERTRGEIFINIKEDGRIVLNNREMTLDELQETLLSVARNFPGGSVIIRGDRYADLGAAIAVLDCCRKADIQNISIAALPQTSSQGD